MEATPVSVYVQPLGNIVAVADLPAQYRSEIHRGISTGWRSLDRLLQGLRKGELTVVTADTGVGKTTFCTHLMVNCAMQDTAVWINSWEMRPEIIMRKVASIALRKAMKMQNFSEKDNEQFDAWSRKYQIYINPNTIGTDISVLATELKKARDTKGVQIVMLDHLDYLVKNTRAQMHEAIDETVKRLHELAFDLEMHIVLICHPRQTSTSSEEVGIHSLKGSSSIKQYADNVVILHRCSRSDETESGKVKIRVAKNRMFGTEGNAYLFYQPQWDGYLEL